MLKYASTMVAAVTLGMVTVFRAAGLTLKRHENR